MDTVYLKLMRGSRLTNYMGLQMDEGTDLTLGKNYMFIDIPVRGVDEEGKLVTELKRNQHVFIESAASLDVRGMQIIEVEPNPALAALGQVQGSFKVHPGSGKQRIGVWFTARKDVNLTELTYLVRLYMIS